MKPGYGVAKGSYWKTKETGHRCVWGAWLYLAERRLETRKSRRCHNFPDCGLQSLVAPEIASVRCSQGSGPQARPHYRRPVPRHKSPEGRLPAVALPGLSYSRIQTVEVTALWSVPISWQGTGEIVNHTLYFKTSAWRGLSLLTLHWMSNLHDQVCQQWGCKV